MNAMVPANITADVARTPEDRAMTVAEFRELIKAAGLEDATKSEVARVLGVARSHLYRWLDESEKGTPIDEANALYIRNRLKPKRKKK